MTPLRFAFISLFAIAACSHAAHYELKGQVLSVNRDKQEILVKHEEIRGYMMAMTMPYKVRSSALVENLEAGDLINAQLDVQDNVPVMTAITKTGHAPPDLPKPTPSVPGSGFIEIVREGQEVPDQAFIDQDGKPRRLSDVRDGHAIALTFIYTKCPMPTYCPMMDRNFVEVQKRIKANPALGDKARLVSVSFDPKNDTPPVLKKHARGLGADAAVWTFVTGDQDAIDRFAMSLGLTLIRGEAPDPNEIGHTLRTVIIDRNGKLVKSYSGNEWTPAEIAAGLEKLP